MLIQVVIRTTDMTKAKLINTVYYRLKPIIPRRLQIWLRRKVIRRKHRSYLNVWPILDKAGEKPDGWPGWPHQRRFAFVITHDVESEVGQQKCHRLMSLEKQAGFRSAFYFVPERYYVLPEVRDMLTTNDFEVGVQGLNHDGKLYNSRRVFQDRAIKINGYIKDWNAIGFRSPAVHHNLEWIHDLNIEYDASTFDTDPFEPQPDGMQTVFPFWVSKNATQEGYVELPYTMPQDFTLFILMKQKNINIWKQKLDWIVNKGGMVLIVTHPDYMNFDGSKLGYEEFPADYYFEFLDYLKLKYSDQYWHALPKEIASYYKDQMVNNAQNGS